MRLESSCSQWPIVQLPGSWMQSDYCQPRFYHISDLSLHHCNNRLCSWALATALKPRGFFQRPFCCLMKIIQKNSNMSTCKMLFKIVISVQAVRCYVLGEHLATNLKNLPRHYRLGMFLCSTISRFLVHDLGLMPSKNRTCLFGSAFKSLLEFCLHCERVSRYMVS